MRRIVLVAVSFAFMLIALQQAMTQSPAVAPPDQPPPLQSSGQAPAVQATAGWRSEYETGKAILDKLRNTLDDLDTNKPFKLESVIGDQPKKALTHLNYAMAQATAANADEDAIADLQFQLAIADGYLGKYEESTKLVRTVKATQEKLHPGPSVRLADCLFFLVSDAQSHGDRELATDLAIDAYDMYLKVLPHDDWHFANVLPVIRVTDDQKEDVEYEKHYLEVFEKRFGPNDPRILEALESYANALSYDFQRAEAIKLYERAREIRKARPDLVKGGISDYDFNSLKKFASGEKKDWEAESKPERKFGRRTQRKMGLVTPRSPDEKEPPSMSDRYGMFDNTTMYFTLQESEKHAASGDMLEAKSEWTRALNFMHQNDWYPSAASVPISASFAKLSDICMDRGMISDADSLLRGAFEFPFQTVDEAKKVDDSAARLVRYYRDHNLQDKRKAFSEFAIKNTSEQRRAVYENCSRP